jgi:hypothetical protein
MSSTTLCPPAASVRYRGLFPDWAGPRRQEAFFLEQLLEARRESRLPTNAAGPDEDVNVYLAGLLAEMAVSDLRDDGVVAGSDPLLLPPQRGLNNRERAEHHRRQGDHRLLSLGLFDRGDLMRRRAVPFGHDAASVRAMDLGLGASAYARAADLLAGRGASATGLVTVWSKLARNFPAYVHVLEVLARRRLGFGARLGEGDLLRLLATG